MRQRRPRNGVLLTVDYRIKGAMWKSVMSRLYNSFVQNFVLPTYDFVTGTSRFKSIRSLQKTQWFSRKEIRRFQTKNLRALLNHSYGTVPYYRRMFKEARLLPSDIRDETELQKLPILTKAIIRENFNGLISRDFPRAKLIPYETGGTGSPMKFYNTKEKVSWELASEFRMFSWAGYRLGDRCFMIWGSPADLSRSRGFVARFTRSLE
ncbi:hypothetical protein MUP77_12075, partial [Candidatus Bathyarchaeota archaeon]|nr:hypothetical protein [Candidatus Bathyarchaeota archaeon]